MKTWIDWLIKFALVVALVFCLVTNHKQNVTIQAMEVNNQVQTQVIGDMATVVDGYNGKLQDIANNMPQQVSEDDINKIVANHIGDDKPVDNSGEIVNMNDKISGILAQLDALESSEDVSLNDIENVITSALVNLSKPTPVVKPMPNIAPVVKPVTLSNTQKADVVNRSKAEVFKAFEKAGYGKFVDGKFELRKGFFGAEILAGDEWKYEPVQSLD